MWGTFLMKGFGTSQQSFGYPRSGNPSFSTGKTGEGNGTPLQYSCLENPMDCGAWWAAVHGVVKSQTRRSDFPFTFMHWRRKWQSTPVFLPGESQGWGSLVGCRLRGRTELDTTEATQQQQQLACFFFTTGEMARSGQDGVW